MKVPRAQFACAIALVAILLPAADAWARAKTDLVFLTNGDRLTCEIKQLDHGILTVGTDAVGTLSIEWEDVDSLSSGYEFRVEDRLGAKYFGTLSLISAGTLRVTQNERTEHVEQGDAVVIVPIEAGLWQQLDGSFSLGASYTKSNNLLQLSGALYVRRRTPVREVVLDASSINTTQSDVSDQRREDLSLTYNRLLKGKFFATASAALQSNDELGLDLRVGLAPGVGVNWIRTNHNDLVSTVGLSVNEEWSADQDGEYNLESFISVAHSAFRYDFPKINLASDLSVYPSLNNWGRVRGELDIDASREIVKDFTAVLTLYDSYDNQPAEAAGAKNDYGLVFSLGWTF